MNRTVQNRNSWRDFLFDSRAKIISEAKAVKAGFPLLTIARETLRKQQQPGLNLHSAASESLSFSHRHAEEGENVPGRLLSRELRKKTSASSRAKHHRPKCPRLLSDLSYCSRVVRA